MLNTNRWLDIAIFTLSEKIKIGDTFLEEGIQQLYRIENIYFFSKIGESPYTQISINYNNEVVKAIFSKSFIYN